VQHNPHSRAKYTALRLRGHNHARALRSVGDRLLNVACAMLRKGTQFAPLIGKRKSACCARSSSRRARCGAVRAPHPDNAMPAELAPGSNVSTYGSCFGCDHSCRGSARTAGKSGGRKRILLSRCVRANAVAFADKEQFRVLYLDKCNALIADEVQQTGTVDHTPVYPPEVIKRVLELSATAILPVHEDPTQYPTCTFRHG
jgi:hypothetical protein